MLHGMNMSKKRKIISITHYCTLYGANRSLLGLIEGTQNQIEWIVFCPPSKTIEPDLKTELSKLNVKFYTIPLREDAYVKRDTIKQTRIFFFAHLCFNFLIAFLVAIYARFKKVDFIHSNSSALCIGAYVSKIGGIQHIWHFREFLDIDYNYSYKFGFKFLTYWANKATKIIAVSQSIVQKSIKDRCIKTGYDIIYNGIITQKEMPALINKTIKNVTKLLMIGVLHENKNQLQAIKASKILNDKGLLIKLTLVGDNVGEYYEKLLAYVKNNNLDNVVDFVGFTAHPDKYYKQNDITLVCSRNEGMGRVTVESLAYSTPVIGYDAAATNELIADAYSGLLYKNDEVNLAEAIERLIGDKMLYENIKTNGYHEVLEKYLVEIYAANFIKSIDQILRTT